MSYSFDDPAIPSLQAMMSRVAADSTLPAERRGTLLSRLRQVARWIKEADGTLGGPSPSEFPFTEAHIEALAKRFVPAMCSRARSHAHKDRSVSKKTVDSAISDCRFLLRYYDLTERQTWYGCPPSGQRSMRSSTANTYACT